MIAFWAKYRAQIGARMQSELLYTILRCWMVVFLLPVICLAETEANGQEREKLPLWEFGVVGIGAYLPHYRGSDEYQAYAFPLPYFLYRGKYVKANRDGVRGIFWRNKRFETDISLSGNPPVSDDNEAREGMPELDGLVEIGPALRYYFHEYGERDSFFVEATVRAAFSFDFGGGVEVEDEGYNSDFSLVYRNSKLLKRYETRFHFNTGIQFADEIFNSFFYNIDPEYVTASRGYYVSKAGYGGFHLSGSVVKELSPKFSVTLYGKWMNINGSVFEDSPLVRSDNNFVLSAMLVWKFAESKSKERVSQEAPVLPKRDSL